MRADREYSEIGRAIEKILTRDYLQVVTSWRRLIWINFVKGIFAGFGGVLGATLLVAALLGLLNLLDALPLVGDWFKSIKESIQV